MKKLILTLCLAATGTFAAVAQMRLTLDQALDLALSENPTVKVAEMEVQRYDYVKRQTWGGLLPQVSVTGQVNHSFIVQQMSKGFSLGNDPYTTLSGAVDASVPLFAPQVYRMMKMNDKQMATAVEAARSSRITLTAEVKKAFYNILLAEQSLDVLRESQATVQRTVDDTQVQYQNGLTSEYDLLTAQVQLSDLKPSILQTENSIRIAKLTLKMYLSISRSKASWTPCATRCSPEPRGLRPTLRTTPTCARSNCRRICSASSSRPRMRAACRPSGRSATSPSPGTTWARCRSIRTR